MTGEITLDLPLPPAVNVGRRIDWRATAKFSEWQSRTDMSVLAQGWRWKNGHAGPYELRLVMREGRHDLDAHEKAIVDYLVRIGVVASDSHHMLRSLHLEFGDAPDGCRAHIRRLP